MGRLIPAGTGLSDYKGIGIQVETSEEFGALPGTGDGPFGAPFAPQAGEGGELPGGGGAGEGLQASGSPSAEGLET